MMSTRLLFPRKQKLTKKSDFTSLYSSGIKKTEGPLLIHRKQNGLGYSRLGLSVPKRVGNAVNRNKIKRLCREAFRQVQHNFSTPIDILITVRPHTPMELEQYVLHISTGVQ